MSKEQINTEFDSLDSFSATSIQEWPLFEKNFTTNLCGLYSRVEYDRERL